MSHQTFLDAACDQADSSTEDGGIGAGAVLVKDGTIVAESHDRTRQLNDPIAVAEVDCIRRAGRRSDQREWTLYSTRYPDMLCAGTLLQFSIGALVVGLPARDTPALRLLKDGNLSVTFVSHARCRALTST